MRAAARYAETTFGQEIRCLRHAGELSQYELARAAGCTQTAMYHIEEGVRRTPPFDKALRTVEALACPDAEADRLLKKALAERGCFELDLADVQPRVIDLLVALGRRIHQGLDPSTAAKLQEVLTSSREAKE
jgi:transcriptional regulator with XRE-family HTH domain